MACKPVRAYGPHPSPRRIETQIWTEQLTDGTSSSSIKVCCNHSTTTSSCLKTHSKGSSGCQAESAQGWKKRQLKREANSEICQIATKRQRICSHPPQAVVEKVEDSNIEMDGDSGMSGFSAGSQNSRFSFSGTSSSAMEESSDHSNTTSSCLKTHSKADFPLEISLMLKVKCQPGSEGPGAAVTLLDWFELGQELILVQEKPVPSIDLLHYIQKTKGGNLEEQEAKMILRKVIKALSEIHSQGVLHRDIKRQNILIETGSEVPRVRIIDFGCGCVLKSNVDDQFFDEDFYGTFPCIPPEWYEHRSYRAGPMTVRQEGVLLYEVLLGEFPFKTGGTCQRSAVPSPPKWAIAKLPGICAEVHGQATCGPPAPAPTFQSLTAVEQPGEPGDIPV